MEMISAYYTMYYIVYLKYICTNYKYLVFTVLYICSTYIYIKKSPHHETLVSHSPMGTATATTTTKQSHPHIIEVLGVGLAASFV